MKTPAWTVAAWPEVFVTVGQLAQAVVHLRPIDTSTHHNAPTSMPRRGQTLWGGCIDGHEVGIAWDWAEVSESVLAVSDPMRVLTNLILMDESGKLLDDDICVLHLNTAIHDLQWQSQVLAERCAASGRHERPPHLSVGGRQQARAMRAS